MFDIIACGIAAPPVRVKSRVAGVPDTATDTACGSVTEPVCVVSSPAWQEESVSPAARAAVVKSRVVVGSAGGDPMGHRVAGGPLIPTMGCIRPDRRHRRPLRGD